LKQSDLFIKEPSLGMAPSLCRLFIAGGIKNGKF